ncbi:MAG: WecB/TagA/CpsF family glycosyltransferase [Acidobacteriota bacterium]|nr:WecB/TagA/CpsF family glycosyltransferase [Acidobacteriota bacterium]
MGPPNAENRTILGIRFFQGTAAAAVDRMSQGGLLVVPAAPALKDLETDARYREALLNADLAITDSAFMVLVWNFIEKDTLARLSGLEYLRELLGRADVRRAGNTLWVKAGEASAARNVAWLREQGIDVPGECVYLAPMYGEEIDDPALLALLERLRPQHVIVTVGGGTQERLGLYLKRRLSYRPSIHCIGAAIAFLSGDQVRIPVWADKLYLGWLFRSLSEPARFIPRYWAARKLLVLMRRSRSRLPGESARPQPEGR